jgi:hypothetical protein
MRRAFLSAAVISLLLGSASATVAQTTEPDLAEVHLGAIAALTLAENWQDWRHDGPENAGICLLGNIETDGRGIQISTITSAPRSSRRPGCSTKLSYTNWRVPPYAVTTTGSCSESSLGPRRRCCPPVR